MYQQHPSRSKPVRRPVNSSHLPPIFRLVGEFRNVIPVDERDLEIMASRRTRLVASRPPVELFDDGDEAA